MAGTTGVAAAEVRAMLVCLEPAKNINYLASACVFVFGGLHWQATQQAAERWHRTREEKSCGYRV